MGTVTSRVNDKASMVRDLARRLASASRAGHWEALRHIDQELTTLLPQLGHAAAWSQDMSQAMLLLQKVHREAFSRCAEAAERLSQRLSEMQGSKDGWMAYAQHSDWNGSAP